MIPAEKTAAVKNALREAFGVTEVEDMRMMTKGQTSSRVLRIVVGGSPFLMKITTLPYGADTIARQFAYMRAAAEGGLAPRVRYSSVEDQISITDFVEAVPFPPAEALVRVPKALRALHALPPFPEPPPRFNTTCTFLLDEGPALDGFLHKFQAETMLPPAEMKELLALRAQLAAAYPRSEADLVSSHNDLFKPDNVLFDGARIWLVDWEAAFRNDRHADLAVMAHLVAGNDEQERVYLQEYFGKAPDERQLARFFLMRQVSHLFYAMAYLWLGSAGKPVDLSGKTPDFGDFHRRIWAGEVRLEDKETKVTYARIHRERLLRNVRDGRFAEAARIVSERGGGS